MQGVDGGGGAASQGVALVVRWGVRLGRTRTKPELCFTALVQRLFAFSVSQQLSGSHPMHTGEEGWLQ